MFAHGQTQATVCARPLRYPAPLSPQPSFPAKLNTNCAQTSAQYYGGLRLTLRELTSPTMIDISKIFAACVVLLAWMLAVQVMWPAGSRSSGANRTRTSSNDGARVVYCPGRKYLGHGGSNLVVEDYTNHGEDNDEGTTLEYSHCYTTPPRLYNPRPYCIQTEKRHCTPENVIKVCYNTASCAPGYVRVSAVANRYSDRSGGRVESHAVCCR